jgi:hypothetical protein
MANKRYHFEIANVKTSDIYRKYGKDPEEALFRFQLDLLRSQIDPKVFRAKSKDKKPKAT